ncbi:hypothetical protein, partial [Mycobacterium avium]|uniref:hypothetical protein n=1 Tax=Mycobacterium avium TaxID=1764 RepID=UPI0026662D49
APTEIYTCRGSSAAADVHQRQAPPRPPRRPGPARAGPAPTAEREVNFTLACERETSFTFGE